MSTDWIGPAVAAIPAAGAIVAAIIAGRYASRSKQHELDAARLLELERRVSASRTEIYESFFDTVDKIWTTASDGSVQVSDDATAALFRFMHWVQVYGSDRSVQLAHRFMQAMFVSAPSNILLRLLGEVFLEGRRELGYPDTKLTVIDLLGVRINDIYTEPGYVDDFSLPLDQVYARHHWTPPWSDARAKGLALKPAND
jgi:hypothetical protein